jgi:SAM-dependent methyltransferase
MTDLARLYRFRFNETDRARKMLIWKVLCEEFFQKLVGENKVVLDLASGYGEFSNNIQATRKIAVDINPDAKQFLPNDVEFHSGSATDIRDVESDTADVVFTSNFLEHLRTKEELDRVFLEILRILKPGGKFIVMGPNIRYLADQYWDFYDHHLPLSHLSVEEGLVQSGFEIDMVKARFLPYTTRSALPQNSFLVSTYLKLPVLWQVFGKQFLVVGRKQVGAQVAA